MVEESQQVENGPPAVNLEGNIPEIKAAIEEVMSSTRVGLGGRMMELH